MCFFLQDGLLTGRARILRRGAQQVGEEWRSPYWGLGTGD